MLQRCGKISNLKCQVEYVLFNGNKENKLRKVSYIADFVYNDYDGKLIVEDTKGILTPAYIVKRAWLHQIYGIRILDGH
jgi:hypothetical protein